MHYSSALARKLQNGTRILATEPIPARPSGTKPYSTPINNYTEPSFYKINSIASSVETTLTIGSRYINTPLQPFSTEMERSSYTYTSRLAATGTNSSFTTWPATASSTIPFITSERCYPGYHVEMITLYPLPTYRLCTGSGTMDAKTLITYISSYSRK